MAKRGVLTHRKTRRLSAILKQPLWAALGLLESLWHFTAESCPRGDIGRLSNQDIADGLWYDGDADELIEALKASGWLTMHGATLIVAGWSEHADDAVRRRLHRNGETFSDGASPYRDRVNHVPTSPDTDASCRVMTEQSSDVSPQSHVMKRLPEPEPEPEPENSKSPNKKKSTSEKGNASQNSRPTLASWLAYAQEISYPEHDAQRAFDHYEANGWRQKGGNPIRDWKAACRTCKSRFDEGPKTKPPEPRRTNTLPDSAFLPGGVS